MRPAVLLALALLLAPVVARPGDRGAPAPDSGEHHDPSTAPASIAIASSQSGGRDGFALPFVFYTPDTRLGIGGTGGLHVHLHGASRPSSVFATAIYTLEGQSAIDLVGQLYPNDRWAFQATARATHFPTAYYGVGPDSARSDREGFTQRYADLALVAERAVVRGLRAGPRLHLRAEEIRDVAPDGALATQEPTGADGFGAVGVGGGVTWDDRDNLFAPARGKFAEAWALAYPALDGHETFARAALDLRAFASPRPGHVLAAQAYAEAAMGDVPLTLLPRFGGATRMRGYAEGRYRDRYHYALQGEWRFPLFRRLGGAAFATAGDVAPSVSAFDLRDVKLSAGAGLRFRLTKEGAAVRVDVAGAREGMSFYAVVLQAF